MAIEAEALRALSEKASGGKWSVFDVRGIVEIQDKAAKPIIHWSGFDQSSLPKGKQRANARLAATLVNAYRDAKLIHASVLSNPVAVHANMLAGTIAKPSVEQILHLYPDLIHRSALAEDTTRAVEGMQKRCEGVARYEARKARMAMSGGCDGASYLKAKNDVALSIAALIRALPLDKEAAR